MKSNGELARNLQVIADLLKRNRLCEEKSADNLLNAKAMCEGNPDKNEWNYSLLNNSSLEFSSLDINKNIRPIGLNYRNLRLRLSIDVSGVFAQTEIKDSIKDLNLQFIIFEKKSEISINRLAWHLDKHFILRIDENILSMIDCSNISLEMQKRLKDLRGKEFREKNIFLKELIKIFGDWEAVKKNEDELIYIFGEEHFSHPEYHIQYGGNGVLDNNSFNYGDFVLIETPRIPFPPMDVFLAVDFILHNFISRSRHKKITEDETYKNIIKDSKELIWRPYYLSIASKWEKSIKTNWSYDTIMDGKFSL